MSGAAAERNLIRSVRAGGNFYLLSLAAGRTVCVFFPADRNLSGNPDRAKSADGDLMIWARPLKGIFRQGHRARCVFVGIF